MRERLMGFLLMCMIVPLAIVGYFILVLVGFFGKNERGRAGVRALDQFVNATVFNGYAWESVSSHAWRERHRRWAKAVIWLMDHLQKDHCQRANSREQRIVNLVRKKRLDKETLL